VEWRLVQGGWYKGRVFRRIRAIRVLLTTQPLVISRIKMTINKNRRNSRRWVAGSMDYSSVSELSSSTAKASGKSPPIARWRIAVSISKARSDFDVKILCCFLFPVLNVFRHRRKKAPRLLTISNWVARSIISPPWKYLRYT